MSSLFPEVDQEIKEVTSKKWKELKNKASFVPYRYIEVDRVFELCDTCSAYSDCLVGLEFTELSGVKEIKEIGGELVVCMKHSKFNIHTLEPSINICVLEL